MGTIISFNNNYVINKYNFIQNKKTKKKRRIQY